MKVSAINTDSTWQTLNRMGSRPKQVDFAQQVQQAFAAKREQGMPAARPELKPLTVRDFVDGNAAYPGDTGATLKPLEAADLGGRRTTSLKPLTELDRVPGAVMPEEAMDRRQRLEAQAEKWVSQTFYGTMLRQMRNSPFKSEVFGGGRGGQAYSSLLDQHLADRMAGASSNKLVRAIVKELEKKGQGLGAMRTGEVGSVVDVTADH